LSSGEEKKRFWKEDLPDEIINNYYTDLTDRETHISPKLYELKGITGPLDMQIREACKFVERNMRMYAVKPPRIEGSPA